MYLLFKSQILRLWIPSASTLGRDERQEQQQPE
jgi:hypothetical protein